MAPPTRELRAPGGDSGGAAHVAFDLGKVQTFAGGNAPAVGVGGGLGPGDANGAAERGGGRTLGAPGEDEIEARLGRAAPPGVGAGAQAVGIGGGTATALARVQVEGETPHGAAKEARGGGRDGEAGRSGETKGGQRHGGSAERGSRAGGREAGVRAGGGGDGEHAPAAATPGPAGAFEAMLSEEVAAYLDGNLAPERQAKLGGVTAQLLQAADTLGQRKITDPDAAALRQLEAAAQPAAAKTGYEAEPLWLRTLAGIRDFTAQAGGIVGIIGLVATVSGFILSLLIPPVGAFLLTVGRFCDVAALVLDIVSGVLGAILTGYNLYRLKRETNPAERRRLLGMVRQDAMGTVMSGVAIATALVPGAGRALGKSGLGRATGRLVSAGGRRVAAGAVRLASGTSRVSRLAAGVGRVGGAGLRGAARLGRAARGRFHTFAGRVRDYGLRGALSTSRAGRLAVRVGSTRVARGIGGLAAAGFGQVRRGARWVGQTRAGRWVGQTRVGRYARRVYGENLELSGLLHANSERYHHLHVGEQLKSELASMQRGGALASEAAARAQLQARFPAQQFPEVNINNLDLKRRAVPAAPAGAAAPAVPAAPGPVPAPALQPFDLVRNKSRLDGVLRGMRAQEAADVRALINANPAITDAALAQQLNARPNARARWTEDEIWAFRQLPNGTLVPKTPHHTISVLDAPHLQYDTRYIQLGNAPLVAQRGRAVSEYEQFATRAARRPAAAGAAAVDAPFVRRAVDARGYATGTTRFADGRPLTGTFHPDHFRSEEFFRELRLQGNTGIWINPNDPTQRLLFDAHFVGAHRWTTGEAGARALFGPTVESAERFQGAVGRTLLDQSVKAYGRGSAHYSDGWRGREQSLADAILMGTSAVSSAALSEPEMQSRLEGATAPPAPEPEAPPAPVPHSPGSLAEVQQQRAAVLEAVAAVNEHIATTHKAERDNRLAKEAALALKERNADQAAAVSAERVAVAGEQGKLTQAGTAQGEMAAQNKKASKESAKGKSEADGVQAQGKNVSVEAKPETPQNRNWLERAWDATGGALWNELIAPAIRLVRRKVSEVMESINQFIMKMINQALGLDQIEAELNAGGQDIGDRKKSLGETETGLDEASKQCSTEQATNQQSAELADSNIAGAQGARKDAEGLLGRLLAQNRTLQAEEATGRDYIAAFGPRYEPYFKQSQEAGGSAEALESSEPEPAAEAEDGAGADAMTEAPALAEAPPEPDSPDGADVA